jgi:MOSC domain-containing protein YiiM
MGRLLGIARRDRPRAPMERVERVEISPERGVDGDYRGVLSRRQVTVLSREAWEAAFAALGRAPQDWWMRRANLLVEGIDLPQKPATRIVFASGVILEVTGETEPCERMEEVAAGLCAALAPQWRGGVTTRVVKGGSVAVGDEVRIELS